MFWPGITNDVINCNECDVFKASQPREPLMQDMIPTRPGEVIAADLFPYMGRESSRTSIAADQHCLTSEDEVSTAKT